MGSNLRAQYLRKTVKNLNYIKFRKKKLTFNEIGLLFMDKIVFLKTKKNQIFMIFLNVHIWAKQICASVNMSVLLIDRKMV